MVSHTDMQRYAVRLNEVASALENDPRFSSSVNVSRGFSSADFADLEAMMREEGLKHVPISDELRTVFGAVNGLKLQWVYDNGADDAPTGSAVVAGVHQLLLPEMGPRASLYDAAGTFDQISPDEHVSIKLNKALDGAVLTYVVGEDDRHHPLDLDLREYLSALCECRAMSGWQRFFVDDPHLRLSADAAEAFLQSVQELFPDADLALFEEHSK